MIVVGAFGQYIQSWELKYLVAKREWKKNIGKYFLLLYTWVALFPLPSFFFFFSCWSIKVGYMWLYCSKQYETLQVPGYKSGAFVPCILQSFSGKLLKLPWSLVWSTFASLCFFFTKPNSFNWVLISIYIYIYKKTKGCSKCWVG